MAEVQTEIVISGIGGKFPECCNVLQLQNKLFSKEDCTRSERIWPRDVLGEGRIPERDTFDATIFKMNRNLVEATDPTTTQAVGRAFEAIVDAGLNPFSMSGRQIAVVSTSMTSDPEILRTFSNVDGPGYSIMGHNKCMMANRISYTFNYTGPSYTLQSSWAGGVDALQQAASLVAQGHAEAAVVTAASLIFHKATSTEYQNLNILTPDGRCRSFDAAANGTCRSEGVVSFFLQRASDAKRNYATLIGIHSECLGMRACSFPHFDSLVEEAIRKFYKDNKIDMEKIAYLEADGSGIKDFDTLEMNALSSVFFEKRKAPLLVGSVKSNVGNTDVSSAFVGITKCLIAMETGLIPPNIHYSKPNPDVPALVNGQFQPVTEATELKGDLMSLNVLSLNGTVGHVVIKRSAKQKQKLNKGLLPPDGLHRLITVSARHEEGAKLIVEKLQNMAVDIEYASMINDVFKTNIPGYLWQAYVVVPTNEIAYNIKKSDEKRRPIWYVFSGMGSQWPGMGRDLLKIPIFSAAVDRCDAVLRPLGLDIRHILTTDEKSTFDNVTNCFVAIAAVQVGLVDILRAIGVEPDGMVGHSLGEMGCAYADGCFTAEEMVLASYTRGKASLEAGVIPGMMAAIGLGYKEMSSRVPPSIDIACHNASDNCTLSGPTDDVNNYVNQLKDQGVFARAVSAGNIAYHSRYIESIAPKFRKYLLELIKDPKRRSAKWISSSVPEAHWSNPEAQFSSAEYHTNNLRSPVLFEEACVHIPDDAIVIEIAPHGLLQAILRRSLSKKCVNVPLTNRSSSNSVRFLLDALGRLYLNNAKLDVNALYPPVEYPVSRGTPYISPLVTWDHSEHWFQDLKAIIQVYSPTPKEMEIELVESATDYLLWAEHRIEDHIVLSPAQILMYIWDLYLSANDLEFEKEVIQIENMVMSNQVVLHQNDQQLLMAISNDTSSFWIRLQDIDRKDETYDIMTGHIQNVETSSRDHSSPRKSEDKKMDVEVDSEEVESVLSQFGYQLGPQFQLIRRVNLTDEGITAKVTWNGKMITFIDALFKLVVFLEVDKQRKFLYPSGFSSIVVDAPKFLLLEKGTEVDVFYDSRSHTLQCAGLMLVGLLLSPDSSLKKKNPEIHWDKKCFIPFNIEISKLDEFLTVSLQVVADEGLNRWRQKGSQVSVITLIDEDQTQFPINIPLQEIISDLPHIDTKVQKMSVSQAKSKMSEMFRPGESWLIVGGFGSLQQLLGSLGPNGFLLAHVTDESSTIDSSLVNTILAHKIKSNGKLLLLKKRTEVKHLKIINVTKDSWLSEVSTDADDERPVAVISRSMGPDDILPELSKLKCAHRLRCLFLETSSPSFSPQHPLYKSHLSQGLAVGMLSKEIWGTECLLPLATKSFKQTSCGSISSLHDDLDVNVIALNPSSLTYPPEKDYEMNMEEVKLVDYCGTRSNGENVMGIAQFDSLTNTIIPDPTLCWPLPPHWTMEDASTVPVAFTLAYYILLEVAHLKDKEAILVHMGTSPVGQACIAVAIEIGANVFATIDTQDQLQSLLQTFPKLKKDQVIYLEQFDIKVKKQLKGSKINVVVNCLAEKTNSSISVLAARGRFIHLSTIEHRKKETVGMLAFLRSIKLVGVSLLSVKTADANTKSRLSTFLEEGLKKGVVIPMKKKIFALPNFMQAINNAYQRWVKEKSVVKIKPEGRLESSANPTLEFFCLSQCAYFVIGGVSGGDLWMDLVEWLVSRGARRLVVSTPSAHLNICSAHRLDHLINRNYIRVMLTSAPRIRTLEDANIVLDKAMDLGLVEGIFFVGVHEHNPMVSHIDAAARQKIPDLKHFVCLLGGDHAVCQSRVQNGLSSTIIQSRKPLIKPQTILPYLSTVLADPTSHAYLVRDELTSSSNIREKYIVEEDPYNFLPSSLHDLVALGTEVSSVPCLREVVTRSPPHWNIKYNILPVFVLPGISAANISSFLSKLMHPAYCTSLSDTCHSIDSFAEALKHEFLKVQRQGPYNIVGETWSGRLALQLASLLEKDGHTVELFLLQGAPAVAHQWAEALAKNYSLEISLLANLLSLENKVVKLLAKLTSWDKQLDMALKYARLDSLHVTQPGESIGQKKESLIKAFTALRNQLKTNLEYKPLQQIFKGKVHLLLNKDASYVHNRELEKCCQLRPTVHVVDESHSEATRYLEYGNIVNQNALYTWDL